MISVHHLTKQYGAQVAIDDLSFAIDKGEVVGFLGPNGAGKSTTLRILAGFLGPTSGSVKIAGHDIEAESIEARRCIGYMPEGVPLYPEMRVIEYLRFRAELKAIARSRRAGQVDKSMVKAGVVEVAHKRIAHLSKGYRQRVGIADAILSEPPIVILDEPTAGLDPNQIRETRSLVRELGREHAVVLSTHILGEAEACATRVLLLHRGKLVAQGATADIRAMRNPRAVDFTIRGDVDRAEHLLRSVIGVRNAQRVGTRDDCQQATVRAHFASDIERSAQEQVTEACVAALVGATIGVREVRATGSTLEDVFAALTEHETSEPANEASVQ